jgi:hypothetical protein
VGSDKAIARLTVVFAYPAFARLNFLKLVSGRVRYLADASSKASFYALFHAWLVPL